MFNTNGRQTKSEIDRYANTLNYLIKHILLVTGNDTDFVFYLELLCHTPIFRGSVHLTGFIFNFCRSFCFTSYFFLETRILTPNPRGGGWGWRVEGNLLMPV